MIWLFWLLFVMADAHFNHMEEIKRLKIHHGINGLYRIAVGGLFVWVFHLTGLVLLMFSLGGFFSFWLLFNLMLNWLNAEPLDYLGSGSILDRFEAASFPFEVWLVWKIILSAGFIYAYYHTDLL